VEETGNIFCGNLSWAIDDDQLKELFGAYGTVISARVICDRNTGHSRGFGFVEMADPSEAEKAIDKLNGAIVMNRPLRLDHATRPAYAVKSSGIKF
jgi:RNA recognition motif-containing protein